MLARWTAEGLTSSNYRNLCSSKLRLKPKQHAHTLSNHMSKKFGSKWLHHAALAEVLPAVGALRLARDLLADERLDLLPCKRQGSLAIPVLGVAVLRGKICLKSSTPVVGNRVLKTAMRSLNGNRPAKSRKLVLSKMMQ